MKKLISFLLIIIMLAFVFASCIKEVVSYCPYCGQSSIKEHSKFNSTTGLNESYYECLNTNCHCKFFGAGSWIGN